MIEIILAVLFIFCTVRQVISLLSMKRSRDFLASKTTPIMNESNYRILLLFPFCTNKKSCIKQLSITNPSINIDMHMLYLLPPSGKMN